MGTIKMDIIKISEFFIDWMGGSELKEEVVWSFDMFF